MLKFFSFFMAEKLKYATLSKTLNRWNFSGGLRLRPGSLHP